MKYLLNLSICFFLISSLHAQRIDLTFSNDYQAEKNLQVTDDSGALLQLSTQSFKKRKQPQILLEKKDPNGKTIWSRNYGGNSYERAGALLATSDGGYLILGSTSSYGKGNYDLWLVKTDEKGREIWNQTYGGFYNEYGYGLKVTKEGNYLIRAKQQVCEGAKNNFSACKDYIWLVETDTKGKEIRNQTLDVLAQ